MAGTTRTTADVADGATYEIRALGPDTWDAFAGLVERHNGIFGGCWCIWFHPDCEDRGKGAEMNRLLKERHVREGTAHAALVMVGDEAVAWAEHGTPAELPSIHHRKDYEKDLEREPDQRITCVFVDRRYRRKGLWRVVVQGALDQIAEAGGGLVESYPQDLEEGRKISASFLYNGTRRAYESLGFTYDRPKGKNHCVMRRVVEPR